LKQKTVKNEDIKEEEEAAEKVPSDSETVKPKKSGLKTLAGKKKTVAKKPEDTLSRFFNSYGESPHLQAIEDSYLKYLQS
jgi:hypothetical protein